MWKSDFRKHGMGEKRVFEIKRGLGEVLDKWKREDFRKSV